MFGNPHVGWGLGLLSVESVHCAVPLHVPLQALLLIKLVVLPVVVEELLPGSRVSGHGVSDLGFSGL